MKHIAQDCIQVGFECFQRRFHNLSGNFPMKCASPTPSSLLLFTCNLNVRIISLAWLWAPICAGLSPGGESCLWCPGCSRKKRRRCRPCSVLSVLLCCGLCRCEEEARGFRLQRCLSCIIIRLQQLKQTDSSTS